MITYTYWRPGGFTGEVKASSPFSAACKALEEKVLYCGFTDPWNYVGEETNRSIKIWEKPFEECHIR